MKYRLIIPKRVKKQIAKIEPKYRLKVLAALTVIESQPFSGKKLRDRGYNEWSYRVWPYRIVYLIDGQVLEVLIVKVDHRKDVYR